MPRKRKQLKHIASLVKRRIEAAQPEQTDSDEKHESVDAIDLCTSDDESYDWPNDEQFTEEDEIQSVLSNIQLVWEPDAGQGFRKPYTGDSRATYYRRQAENRARVAIAAKCKPITDLFQLSEEHSCRVLVPPTKEQLLEKALDSLDANIRVVNNQALEKKLSSISKFDHIRLIAIRRFLELIKSGEPKVESSLKVATVLFSSKPNRSMVHRARTIRNWAQFYIATNELPSLKQGRHQKTRTLIDDEDVQNACRTWLRSQTPDSICARLFARWVSSSLHVELDCPGPIIISERTAQRWFHRLDFFLSERTQGLYFDGHERGDVVEYRKAFLQEMESYQSKMFTFSGENLEIITEPVLMHNEKPIVLVTHDESCFSSFDGKKTVWLEKDRRPLKTKGQGRSIMVSELLCECHGRLALSDEQPKQHPDVPPEARIIIKPGKNGDGYWKNEDLVKQIRERAIPIFKILHPVSDALFAFDNSQNHHAMAPDALVANRLNLSDGGKNVKLQRDGWYMVDGVKVNHALQTIDGVQKGLKTILVERQLWPDSGLTLADARQLLSEQPDFQSQRDWLTETVHNAGSGLNIIFYPKFHCEFNFIEMYWGYCKKFTRANCDYSFQGLVNILPKTLNSVPLSSIRKFARKSWRYMDAYREKNGQFLTMHQVEFAVRKYKSHRSVPQTILNLL